MTKTIRTASLTAVIAVAFTLLMAALLSYGESRNANERASLATSEPKCEFAELQAGEAPSSAIVRTTKEMRDVGVFGPDVLIDLDNADEAGQQWLSNTNADNEGLQPGALTMFCTTNLHVTQVGFVELR